MSPVVRISDETYLMLQSLAKPFVDTPETVICRLAQQAIGNQPVSSDSTTAIDPKLDSIKQLDLTKPVSLTHAKLRYARFGDQLISQPNWNKLSRTAHSVAMAALGNLDVLRHISEANIRSGRYENEGFAYLADADISVQGQDSQQAWASSLAIAKELGFDLDVVVYWLEKEGAALPGQQRRMVWNSVPTS